MNEGIGYALLSLLFAGASDTVFKRQATSGYCVGQYMIVVGAVWTIVFSIAAFIQNEYMPNSTTIFYSLITGMFSAIANYLLIYSMQKLQAGIAATIYRLNMAIAVFIAVIFINESISLPKIIGISIAIISILLFFDRSGNKSSVLSSAVFIAIIASMLRALMGIGYKLAMAKGVQHNWFLAGNGLCWIFIGLFNIISSDRIFKVHIENIWTGILSGLLICGIVFFFAKALACGQASVIIPIAQMSFIITTLLAWFIWKEKLSKKVLIGMVLACISIFLLSSTR
jgi:drug/metabolite transporter (DMT)-like permease